jgi:hypothetical protein
MLFQENRSGPKRRPRWSWISVLFSPQAIHLAGQSIGPWRPLNPGSRSCCWLHSSRCRCLRNSALKALSISPRRWTGPRMLPQLIQHRSAVVVRRNCKLLELGWRKRRGATRAEKPTGLVQTGLIRGYSTFPVAAHWVPRWINFCTDGFCRAFPSWPKVSWKTRPWP